MNPVYEGLKEVCKMTNTYFYTRMLAEDVQAAELQIEYNKHQKTVHKQKPIINQKEVLAEAVYQKMMARKAQEAA